MSDSKNPNLGPNSTRFYLEKLHPEPFQGVICPRGAQFNAIPVYHHGELVDEEIDIQSVDKWHGVIGPAGVNGTKEFISEHLNRWLPLKKRNKRDSRFVSIEQVSLNAFRLIDESSNGLAQNSKGLKNILLDFDSVQTPAQQNELVCLLHKIELPFSFAVSSGDKGVHIVICLKDLLPPNAHADALGYALIRTLRKLIPADFGFDEGPLDGARKYTSACRLPGLTRIKTGQEQVLVESWRDFVDYKDLEIFLNRHTAGWEHMEKPKGTKSRSFQADASVDSRIWVDSILESHLSYRYDGTCRFKDEETDLGSVQNFLLLQNHKQNLRTPPHVINASLENFIKNERKKILQMHRDLLMFTEPNREVERFIRAVTGKEKVLDVAVLKQFIWLVKRKLFGLDVEHHLMPVFSGGTAVGKTEAIRKLASPLQAISEEGRDLSIFGDERQWGTFHKSYIIILDEMAKALKCDFEALKNVITAKNKPYRKLGTNLTINGLNVSSFIGSTNHHIVELIKDPTSARRFWQIEVPTKCDWQEINAIDYVELWRGIDEKAPAPILPFIEELHKAQDTELRHTTTVEDWIHARCEVVEELCTASKDLFENFKEFSDWGNYFQISHKQFGHELKKVRGIQSEKLGGNIKYNLRIIRKDLSSLVSGG